MARETAQTEAGIAETRSSASSERPSFVVTPERPKGIPMSAVQELGRELIMAGIKYRDILGKKTSSVDEEERKSAYINEIGAICYGFELDTALKNGRGWTGNDLDAFIAREENTQVPPEVRNVFPDLNDQEIIDRIDSWALFVGARATFEAGNEVVVPAEDLNRGMLPTSAADAYQSRKTERLNSGWLSLGNPDFEEILLWAYEGVEENKLPPPTPGTMGTISWLTNPQTIPGVGVLPAHLVWDPGLGDWVGGYLTDPELVEIVKQYNATYTDTGEGAPFLPENNSTVQGFYQSITHASTMPGFLSKPGQKQSLRLRETIQHMVSKPQEKVRLKKYEGAGIEEIQALAPQIINAPDWGAALQAAGSNPTILETIGDTLAMNGVNRITGAAVAKPVARAFRELEYWSFHRSPAIDTRTGKPLNTTYPETPYQKRNEIKYMISARLAGVPYVPGTDAGGLLGYVELAEMIWKMTWRSAELGDASVNYAWKTYNLHLELMGDKNVHDLWKRGKGREVLMRTRIYAVHVQTFWEALADQIGDSQSEAIGLKVRNAQGNLVMAKSFESASVEDIDWTTPVKPLLISVSNSDRKADMFRDLALKRSILNSPELPGLINVLRSGSAFNDLKGLVFAQTACGLFDVIAEYDLQRNYDNEPNVPDYRGVLGPFLSELAKSLDFNVPGVRNEFKRIEDKYFREAGRYYRRLT